MKEQLGLFAQEVPKTQSTETKTEWKSGFLQLGEAVPPHIFLGTSSWTFPGWANIVYRKSYKNQKLFLKDALEEYCAYPLFRTVGIDRSFYRPLDGVTLQEYSKQLPDDFKCVLKVWNELTTAYFPNHPSLKEKAGKPNPNFLNVGLFKAEVIEPLRQHFSTHVGSLVLEFPPSTRQMHPTDFLDRLGAFLDRAPRDFEIAVELRDARLLNQAYGAILKQTKTAHVFNFWSHMPSIQRQATMLKDLDPRVFVIRLVLPPGKSYNQLKKEFAPFDRISVPQVEMRKEVAELCLSAEQKKVPAFVLVNNKAEGCSPRTVEALARHIVHGNPPG